MTSLALNRLGEREAAAIIAGLVGNKALPADVMAEIVDRSDGIPLLVEEMTKAVLEADAVSGIKAALRDLAQTDGKDLAQDEQAILVAIVHIAFLGVRAGKEPQEIAAEYMKKCVAMNPP